MNEQDHARQGGYTELNLADVGHDQITRMARKYREKIDEFNRTDGVKNCSKIK